MVVFWTSSKCVVWTVSLAASMILTADRDLPQAPFVCLFAPYPDYRIYVHLLECGDLWRGVRCAPPINDVIFTRLNKQPTNTIDSTSLAYWRQFQYSGEVEEALVKLRIATLF